MPTPWKTAFRSIYYADAPAPDDRDRSLSQKMPGWNNLLWPKSAAPSQVVPQLSPAGDEIVVTKTTDSALTGTNLRLILHNLGIRHVICTGIFTDHCASSTVRGLADESSGMIVLKDCCAWGHEIHAQESAKPPSAFSR